MKCVDEVGHFDSPFTVLSPRPRPHEKFRRKGMSPFCRERKGITFLVSAKYVNASVVRLVSPRGKKGKAAIKNNNDVHTFLQCENIKKSE